MSLKIGQKLRTNYQQAEAVLLLNAIFNNFFSQKREFLAMCWCFFGESSNFSANEGCLTHFVGK